MNESNSKPEEYAKVLKETIGLWQCADYFADTAETSGWRADYGNTSYGYIVDWPPHVKAIFDWLMDTVLGRR